MKRELGMSHREVSELTPGQQSMYLEGLTEVLEGGGTDPRTGRKTVKFDSLAEALEYGRKHGR
jgi:hypothetical protein